jgi:hypothetical protein
MVLTAKSFAKDAYDDLKDLMEVCPDCFALAELDQSLYAHHLYLAHLRDCGASPISQDEI